MSNKNYNIFFNTHTVSGIIVSIALYIIFLAGAFALFKVEIEAWEKSEWNNRSLRENIDFDFLLEKLAEDNFLLSRDLKFYLEGDSNSIYLLMSAAKDSIHAPEQAKTTYYKSLDLKTANATSYTENYSYGEFLYRLHFFSQLPRVGVYLAGIVSLLFFFAIITGIIVHWKKMFSSFYQFNPKSSLKRIWSDAHTTLGFIGLPFQLIYALTGAYFGLSILVLIPANFLYGGDSDKLMNDLRPDRKSYEWISELETEIPSVNDFVLKNFSRWDYFNPKYLLIKNFKGSNMRYELIGELHDSERFISSGIISYDIKNNLTEELSNPNELNYISDVQMSLSRLHFANFGGQLLKVLFFILALITCFVIVSGVLIWMEARNKKNRTSKQRKFSARTGSIYISLCLSLLPVIAFFFIVVKLLPAELASQKMSVLYNSFFWLWLLLSAIFYLIRDNYLMNKVSLILVTIFGILIPIVNGITSGNWIWKTFLASQQEILLVDVLWFFLSIVSFTIVCNLKPRIITSSNKKIV